jgi:hypothetical protein
MFDLLGRVSAGVSSAGAATEWVRTRRDAADLGLRRGGHRSEFTL